MGFLSSTFSQKAGNTLDLLRQSLYGMGITSTGKTVTTKTAMQVSTVFAVCRVLGEGVAQVPLKLMKESPDGRTRLPVKDHPLYRLLFSRPNEWQTSFDYREMLMWHLVLAGSHFSYINRDRRGNILELIPFEPGRVTVKQAEDYTLTYEVRGNNGQTKVFAAEDIWHIKGPSWDGWQALEPVKLAREAIGVAMATEQAVGSLHKNGMRPAGAYSVEGTLTGPKYEELQEWLHKNNAGAENAGKPLILDRKATWLNIGMKAVDAQSADARRFQIEEICRFARVMPIMVGSSDKATTYASAEQMFLAHVVHTLAPWYQRLEQSIDEFLLTDADREAGIYSCFVEEGLLRGSAKDTRESILGYVNGGVMTPNEGRAKLDMNPMDDPESDKLRIPANIVGAVPAPTDTTGATP